MFKKIEVAMWRECYIHLMEALYEEDGYLAPNNDNMGSYTAHDSFITSWWIHPDAFEKAKQYLTEIKPNRWVLNESGLVEARKITLSFGNIPTVCDHCKKRVVISRSMSDIDKMPIMDVKLCFLCRCWHNTFMYDQKSKEWYKKLVINGRHYCTDQPGIKKTYFNDMLGFAGRRFVIQNLETGEQIETNDLWEQGDIPESWRDSFPDNAVFVRKN